MKSWHYNGDSSSSNLSAFAPPFTASPFSPNPNSNPYEPIMDLPSNSLLGSWLSANPQPHFSSSDWSPSLTGQDINTMNYPGEHEFLNQAVFPPATRTFSYGQGSDSLRGNVDEVRPYYPLFYSSHKPEYSSGLTNLPRVDAPPDIKNQMVPRLECPDYVGQLWDDADKREQDELTKLKEGCCNRQGNASYYYSYMNPGTGVHPSIGFSIRGEASNDINLLDFGKLDFPEIRESVDAKSLANDPDYKSTASLPTFNIKYSPMLPATHCEVPSSSFFPGLDQIGQSNINKKSIGQFGSSPGDMNSINVFPAHPTRLPDLTSIFEVYSGDCGNKSAAGTHGSGNDLCNVERTHSAEISEGNIIFDEAQIMSGRGRNSCGSAKLKDVDTQNEQVIPNDAFVCAVRGNTVDEMPYMNGYCSNVSYSDTTNHFSQSADSLFWKGGIVPNGHCSFSLGPSDIDSAKRPLEFKGLDGVNTQKQISQNAVFSLELSSKRLDEAMLQVENQSLVRNSMVHQEQPCIFNLLTTGHSLHGAIEDSSSHIRPQHTHLTELINDCSIDPSQVQKNSSEDKLNPIERKLPGNKGSDKERSIIDATNNDLSDVSFQCVEHVLNSPIVEHTGHSECCREELTSKIDVSAVVRMMHNLSELLMLCSSSDAYDLKEQDCEFLKNATNNLIVLCLENRHLANDVKSKEPRITFVPDGAFLGEFPGVHATLVEMKRPGTRCEMHNSWGKQFSSPLLVGEKKHRTEPTDFEKTGTPVVIGQSNITRDDKTTQNRFVEGQKTCKLLGKPEVLNDSRKLTSVLDQTCEKSPDLSSLGGVTDNIKDDKMTQAVKMILAKNFLEEDEAEQQVQLFKNLWLEAEAALCLTNYRARYDRVKFEMKKYGSHSGKDLSKNTIGAQCLSNDGIRANSSTMNKSADDASKSHHNLDISFQSCMNMNDVMKRFNILKDWDIKSNLVSNLHHMEMTSPKFSGSFKDELASGSFESPAIPAPIISPVKGSTHEADNLQSSILSRLSILKQREENLSSVVNPESEHSQDVSGKHFAGLENGVEDSFRGNMLSISKQPEYHISPSEMEAKEPPKVMNLESSVLSRLSVLLQREEKLSAMESNFSPIDVVNLDSVVQKDYFTPISEKVNTKKDFSSGLFNSRVPESQMTGSSMNGMTTSLVQDFSSSSDWENVLEEDV
ncbi:hypothetical protein SAY86_016097 [Trapa natans]|uniref:Uncharacterized protein n=1 Tax=Trapa natans TaxID=22666 RepID=A0AAN7LBN0_TRANT|nr:hypothetical protein SAY86_016097 [Trapa natans]